MTALAMRGPFDSNGTETRVTEIVLIEALHHSVKVTVLLAVPSAGQDSHLRLGSR